MFKILASYSKINYFGIRFLHSYGSSSAPKRYVLEAETLGFIGVGKIAQAIILGLINKNILEAKKIFVSDANFRLIDELKLKNPLFKHHQINYCNDNKEVVNNVKTLVLSVKPSDMNDAVDSVSPYVKPNHLVMSLAAGVRLNQIEKKLPSYAKVVRVMTNIAALIQEGCSVYSLGKNVSRDDIDLVENLLKSIGTCEGFLDEKLIDVVTALSSSGPAYMYVILDALADGALKMGLNKEFALRLATRTMHGAAAMVQAEKVKHIYQMKDEVCSPAGTTISGITELERHRFRYALMRCIEEATRKAKEMSEAQKDKV